MTVGALLTSPAAKLRRARRVEENRSGRMIRQNRFASFKLCRRGDEMLHRFGASRDCSLHAAMRITGGEQRRGRTAVEGLRLRDYGT